MAEESGFIQGALYHNSIFTMGLFMDAGGIPLAFDVLPGNQNDPARFIKSTAITKEGYSPHCYRARSRFLFS